MTDVTAVRKRLVKRSSEMHAQSKPYVEAIVAGTTAQLPHDRAVADAVEGLTAGNVFAFTLAAVLRVAAESDHPAGPVLAERMARMASEALNSGLDWLDEANDDLDDTEPEPVVRVPGQQEIPDVLDAKSDALPHEDYMQAVFDALDHFGLHPKDVTTTTPDGRQLDGVISFPAGKGYDPDAWPDGVYLGWDQHSGWALCTEGNNRNLYPLNLDVYADPAAVATRAHSELRDEPISWVDESWDGAAAVQAAVEAWEAESGAAA